MACLSTPCALQLKQIFLTAHSDSRLQVHCKIQAGNKTSSPGSTKPLKDGRLSKISKTRSAQPVKDTNSTRLSKDKQIQKRDKRDKLSIEDDDLVVNNTAEWTSTKPTGFGLEKEYDTSLEAKLLEDIEKQQQLRVEAVARRAEMRKLEMVAKITEQRKLKKVAPDGVRVKLKYLPKKKNIMRDLKGFFKGERGLLHIRPNEHGNTKTRDPICKGSASLTFVDEIHALKFVEKYENQKFVFGTVVKQRLGFEIMKEKVKFDQPRALPGPKLDAIDVEVVGSTDASRDGISDDVEEDVTTTDEVQDSLADTIVSDESEYDDEGDEDDEDYVFKVPESFLKLVKELEEEEEDGSDFSDDGEDDGDGTWIDEEEMEGVLPEAAIEGYTEIEITTPKLKDGQNAEEILKSNNIYEIDEKIKKLSKKLRWKRTKELEDQILRLREEKIELLETRILAKLVSGREFHIRRRNRRRQAALERRKSERFGDRYISESGSKRRLLK